MRAVALVLIVLAAPLAAAERSFLVVVSGLGFVDPMQVQLTGPDSLFAFSTSTALFC